MTSTNMTTNATTATTLFNDSSTTITTATVTTFIASETYLSNFSSTTTTTTHVPSTAAPSSFSLTKAISRAGNKEIILFVIFSLGIDFLGVFVTTLSRVADLVKWTKGPSIELIFSIQMSCFYTVFNRSLFQHVGSWDTLIALLFLHLAQHFLIYPLRLTRWYFDLSSKIQEKFLCVPVLGPALYDESPIEVWRVRLNIDMITRYVATESSTLAYILTLAFLRYGWNSNYYAFFASDLPHDDFVRTVTFLTMNVVVEVGFLAVVHVYFVDLARPFARICQYNEWYFWAMIWSIAHVLTDVFLVRAVVNFP